MSDRGMKKWAPYKALVEQSDSLQSAREKKTVQEKPIISDDEAEQINRILVNYNGEKLLARYFRNNKIFEEEIIIKRIDIYEKKLVLTDRRSIKLDELFYLRFAE
mgnify:CR=1 FL=1